MDRVTNEAWVTLCTNDVYAVGALVLASSLQRVGSLRQKAVLVGSNLSPAMRDRLSEVFDWVEEVNVLDSHDTAHLALMARPELGITFTKIHCWKLVQYEKAVFLDADTLVVRNCDDLFDREELSAAPDAGWPDCFNSGVFVFKPSLETYHNLLQFAVDHGSFDGGDQGLLNLYFSGWATGDITRRLPFVYNMSGTSVYTYLPAYRQFGQEVRIVHFLGTKKPWHCTDAASQAVYYSQEHLNSWWHIFREDVQHLISLEMYGLVASMDSLNLNNGGEGSVPTASPHLINSEEWKALQKRSHQEAWERGDIDYRGRDSFDSIMSKINETLRRSASKEKDRVPVLAE